LNILSENVIVKDHLGHLQVVTERERERQTNKVWTYALDKLLQQSWALVMTVMNFWFTLRGRNFVNS